MGDTGRRLLLRALGSCAAIGVLSLVAAAGAVSLSLIDQVVLVGLAAILPLVAGNLPWWWTAAVACAVLAFPMHRGWAAIAVAPAVAAASVVALRRALAAGDPRRWGLRTGAELLALAYGAVAATALMGSRGGVKLFDIHEPIVELTAAHYSFAGTGALFLAAQTLDRSPDSPWAIAGVCVTGVAPVIVALGFVTRSAVPQVGGAVLMACGVWITAALELRDAPRLRGLARVLLTISGLAIWIPMVLAVAWAAGQHWSIPILSVPDMARTHGVANAFAFVLAGLVARRWSPTGSARPAGH